jgi:hypothetical protein
VLLKKIADGPYSAIGEDSDVVIGANARADGNPRSSGQGYFYRRRR